MLAVPAILDRVPQARVVFVGFGSYREHLEGLVQELAIGDPDHVAAAPGLANSPWRRTSTAGFVRSHLTRPAE